MLLLLIVVTYGEDKPAKNNNAVIVICSFNTLKVTEKLLLSPRFTTEAQNNSGITPAGHIYSNVSNAHVWNNLSLLATVVRRTVWIYPDCCPNAI